MTKVKQDNGLATWVFSPRDNEIAQAEYTIAMLMRRMNVKFPTDPKVASKIQLILRPLHLKEDSTIKVDLREPLTVIIEEK